MTKTKWLGIGACWALCVALPQSASAGLLYSVVKSTAPGFGLQPRPTSISVCFYGDALTSRATRVAQIRDALTSNTSAVANVVFTGFGTCATPTIGTCGSPAHNCNQYGGDMRIALDGTKLGTTSVTREIPASFTDCVDHGAPSSWSMFPDVVDDPGHRACPYNSAIGDDSDTSQTPAVPWLNHPLHEVGGHGMGFAHEFLQAGYFNFVGPNGSVCSNSTSQPDGAAHPASYVSLTPTDASSVMMYQALNCGINGNYGFSGYSAWDKLSLHIMYPENSRVAEFFGGTVTTVNQPIGLTQLWRWQGANANVVNSVSWSVGGATSSQVTFSPSWASAGTKTGTLTYKDFLGRTYSANLEVRVYQDDATKAGATVVPMAASLATL